jgi:hypothetical protein
MSQMNITTEVSDKIKHKKFVGGIVRISPEKGKDFPYTFFELDTTDPDQHDFVLSQYKKFNIDVIWQRVGKGYHYFGAPVDIQIWREWYAELKPLNPDFPTITLRITRKKVNEVWEKPVYVMATSTPLNWAKALMHFLSKEQVFENSTNIHTAMNHCGLPKYFKCVVYDVEVPN